MQLGIVEEGLREAQAQIQETEAGVEEATEAWRKGLRGVEEEMAGVRGAQEQERVVVQGAVEMLAEATGGVQCLGQDLQAYPNPYSICINS